MKQLLVAVAICMAATGALAQDKHDHAHDETHSHGEHQDLGTTTVAGIKFEASQLGKLSDKEGVFEVTLAKGTSQPKAVRIWVGSESAEGSVKAKAEGSGTEFEAHVELPTPLPKDAMMWVEIQPADGKKAKASFALKR